MAKARRVGDPWEEGVEQGPQIDRVQRDKILGFIEAGKREGATLEAGGSCEGGLGFFIQPTVFSGLKNKQKISHQLSSWVKKDLIKQNPSDCLLRSG